MNLIPANEPDFKVFTAHGLKCLVLRHKKMGHLCGYVQIPRGTLLWDELKKKSPRKVFRFGDRKISSRTCGYDRKPLRGLDCHGGLTFSGPMHFYRARRGLWVGFDCAHFTDLVPGLLRDLEACGIDTSYHYESGTYKDLAFVEAQCRSLAKQISEVNHYVRD